MLGRHFCSRTVNVGQSSAQLGTVGIEEDSSSRDTAPCRMTGVTLHSHVTPVILHGVIFSDFWQVVGGPPRSLR